MGLNDVILIGYAAFLFILLAINLLYFFQVFKYRLPGDASVSVLVIHLILVLSVVAFGTMLAF
jgi:hypothetical protein